MIAVYEAQNGFVDRACDVEFSERILSNSHVREILVRKHFEDGRWNFRQTGFRIVSVPKVAFAEFSELSRQIRNEIIAQSSCEILGCESGDSAVQHSVIIICGADSEGSDGSFSILIVARITMKRQREFYRHVLALSGRHVNRTAAQPVGHQGTGVDVVGVIIFSFSAAINLVGSACPLGVVPGSFQATGQSAGVTATFYISHAAAKAYSIGSYDSTA